MIKYQRNNIVFRIASSDAIAKFKSVQAHALMQLARSDIGFDLAAREVVLLEYDRLSQWLYRMERILLAVGEGKIPEELRTAVLESFREEMIVVENVIDMHAEVFDKTAAQFTKMIHTYSFALIHEEMSKRMEQTIDRAYGALMDLISEYLQHLLICMHEYNNNIVTKKSEPFLSYGFYCAKLSDTPRHFDPIIRRAEFFVKNGVGTSFVFKNYANGDGDGVYDRALMELRNHGIMITRDVQ